MEVLKSVLLKISIFVEVLGIPDDRDFELNPVCRVLAVKT